MRITPRVRRRLRQLRSGSALLSALLFLFLATRYLSFAYALTREAPDVARSPVVAQFRAENGKLVPKEEASELPPQELGPAKSRILFADLTPARAEVFVNGRSLGHTPLATQLTCRENEVLSVRIVPKQGAPLKRILRCRGESLRVRK